MFSFYLEKERECLFDLVPSSSFEMPRSDSVRSLSSDAESYRSAMLPPTDRNLLATDSSSYASVNERCLSPSTASYHTALTGDTSSSASSIAGYETPTPEFDDDQDTLSSHSSLSDISHAETLEPTGEGKCPRTVLSWSGFVNEQRQKKTVVRCKRQVKSQVV